jgi:hypothetical protein
MTSVGPEVSPLTSGQAVSDHSRVITRVQITLDAYVYGTKKQKNWENYTTRSLISCTLQQKNGVVKTRRMRSAGRLARIGVDEKCVQHFTGKKKTVREEAWTQHVWCGED